MSQVKGQTTAKAEIQSVSQSTKYKSRVNPEQCFYCSREERRRGGEWRGEGRSWGDTDAAGEGWRDAGRGEER